MFRTALLALAILGPVPAAAQGVSLSPFAALDGGLVGSPGVVGLSTTLWLHPVGLRVGGAVDPGYSPLAPALGRDRSPRAAVWSGDVDMVVPGRAVGVVVGDVEPVVFVGFGAHGMRRVDGSTATIPAWSYGGGAAVRVASWLSMDGEARYRMPHAPDAARPDPGGDGWEVRAGLTLHVGRTARTSRPRAPATSGQRGVTGVRMGTPTGADAAPGASGAALARSTLATADRYVGTRYVWGGSNPDEGFDCSGFVQYVFARNGVRLPRVSRDQAGAGAAVPARPDALRPGDLMFFAGNDGVVSHVAIYVGDGRFIHSSGSRGAVGYDVLGSERARWYRTHFVSARRVIPDDSFRLDRAGLR